MKAHRSYFQDIGKRFIKSPLGVFGLALVCIIAFIALYAPFFASSKPLFVSFDGSWYFPLFRYFFSSTFYTKKIDLFCNAVALALPLYFLASFFHSSIKYIVSLLVGAVFVYAAFFHVIDPAIDPALSRQKEKEVLQGDHETDFSFDLRFMNAYAKLNMVLDDLNKERTHNRIVHSLPQGYKNPYTLYSLEQTTTKDLMQQAERANDQAAIVYLRSKETYLQQAKHKITHIVYPLFSIHHWEEDVGGDQGMNRVLPFWELSRLGRQDLLSALIYGARISLFVGLVSVIISLLIGVPLGLISGYLGGKMDMALCRLIEVWEAMPAFFMLLMIVAIVESKSIFLVIGVIALFNWTTAFRYVRAETFRQREMSYVEAGRALGFPGSRILFSQLLPNCIVPVIALLPFDIMAAITREAALAFLGLGEEHSCSWGVLMDEGRMAFPQESALLWPPAIALTVLLMAIAFVGNALQTALDPKG